jgi:hypothetical protein
MNTPKEKPILFTAEMVHAILDNRKTQTRRIVNPQPILHYRQELYRTEVDKFGRCQWRYDDPAQPNALAHVRGHDEPSTIQCPYGPVGTKLWVRETFLLANGGVACYCRADQDPVEAAGFGAMYGGWKPSIHMPRWASRLTLEITSERVERVQSISAEDAQAEGTPRELCNIVTTPHIGYLDWISGYRALWESIHGPGSWAPNQWVWVIGFRKVS